MLCSVRKKGYLKPRERKECSHSPPTYLSLPSPRMHLHMPVSIALLATAHLKLTRVLPHRYHILLF